MTTLNLQVGASSDDAIQTAAGAAATLTDSTFTWSTGGSQYYGNRFTNVTLPTNALVQSAFFQVWVSTFPAKSTLSGTIWAQKAANPGTFTTASNDISGRTATTRTASLFASGGSAGAYATTTSDTASSFTNVICELVRQSTWASGNAMVMIGAVNSANNIGITTFDGGEPAKLSITYVTPNKTVANGGGTWSSNGTWVEGSAPISTDVVGATGTSGNVTLSGGTTVAAVDLTNYNGTLTHNAAVTLTIGGKVSQTNLRLSPTMTYTKGSNSTSAISMTGTNAGQYINTNGISIGNFTMNGAAGTFALMDNLTCLDVITLTAGTFDFSQSLGLVTAISCTKFSSSNSNARGLVGFASGVLPITTWTCSLAGTAWDMSTSTNVATTASLSGLLIKLTGSGATFAGGGLDYTGNTGGTGGVAGSIGLWFSGGGTSVITGSNTFWSLKWSNAAAGTLTLPASGTTTLRSCLTSNAALDLNGSSGNLITLNSSSSGTTSTINFGNASATSGSFLTQYAVSASWLTTQDITITGGANFTLGHATATSRGTNCSGISLVLTVGAGGGISSSSATYSPAIVPTQWDDIILNASSGDFSIYGLSCRSIDGTGYTHTLAQVSGLFTLGAASHPSSSQVASNDLLFKFPNTATILNGLEPSIYINESGGNATFALAAATFDTTAMISYYIQSVDGSNISLSSGLNIVNDFIHRRGTFTQNSQGILCNRFISTRPTYTLVQSVAASGNSGTVTATPTNSPQPGNLLLASVAYGLSVPSDTGWTQLSTFTANLDTVRLYGKVVVAGDTGSFSIPAASLTTVVVSEWIGGPRNADLASLVDVASTSASYTTNSISSSATNELFLALYSSQTAGSFGTNTNNFIEVVNVGGSAYGYTSYLLASIASSKSSSVSTHPASSFQNSLIVNLKQPSFTRTLNLNGTITISGAALIAPNNIDFDMSDNTGLTYSSTATWYVGSGNILSSSQSFVSDIINIQVSLGQTRQLSGGTGSTISIAQLICQNNGTLKLLSSLNLSIGLTSRLNNNGVGSNLIITTDGTTCKLAPSTTLTTFEVNNVTMDHIDDNGSGICYAENSTDNGNNSGWIFNNPRQKRNFPHPPTIRQAINRGVR